MSLEIEQERIHSRAPINAVTLTWWRKSGDEFREAMQERNRSKVGRMARLRGKVEKAEAFGTGLPPSPSSALKTKIQATVDHMRKSGASEADIATFIESQRA